ncbi:MAG: histidine phosphatase family protein [Pseudomonadota bacterium]
MNDQASTPTTIYLLRHAHAAWARPGQRDFDRPLDDRGVTDAQLVAAAFAQYSLLPATILCSTARRCQETCEIFMDHLPDRPTLISDDQLYSRDEDYYVEALAAQSATPVLLIGHNPMMEDTTRLLSASANDRPAERLQKGFPTAGLATIEMPITASSLIQSGHLSAFLSPKRLRKKVLKAGI